MNAWVLTPVPDAMSVRDLLVALLGRDVTVRMADHFSGDSATGSTFAVYVDHVARPCAVAVLDLPCSAYVGAAIGLIPAPGAEAAVEEGDLSPLLRDNLAEVLNVLSALLNADGCPHVRLDAVHHVGSWPEDAVIGLASTPGRRLDLEVDVPFYGQGRLSVIGVA